MIGMMSPMDAAWAILKEWDDVNWDQGGQYSDDPQIEQMIQPWPQGTATGWHYGPPNQQTGEQGPPLSAEQAVTREKAMGAYNQPPAHEGGHIPEGNISWHHEDPAHAGAIRSAQGAFSNPRSVGGTVAGRAQFPESGAMPFPMDYHQTGGRKLIRRPQQYGAE